VITTDTLGRVAFLNAEAERLTGWATAEAAGKRLERIFNSSTRTHIDGGQSGDQRAAQGVVVG
jgi:PAS domain-containing protein